MTTLSYVLKKWVDMVHQEEGIKALYSPESTVVGSVRALRRLQAVNVNNTPLAHGGEPFMVFLRSPLKRIEQVSPPIPRSIYRPYQTGDSALPTYNFIYAETVLQVLFLAKDWKKLEEFEARYVTYKGISGVRSFFVDYGGDIGECEFNLFWGDLNELQVISEVIDVRTLSFEVHLFGWFLTEVTDTGIIKEIDIFYRDYTTGMILKEERITG